MLFEHVNRIGKNVTRINPFIFELIPVFSKKTAGLPGATIFCSPDRKIEIPWYAKW